MPRRWVLVAPQRHLYFNMEPPVLVKKVARLDQSRGKVKSAAEQRRDIYRNLRSIHLNAAKQYEALAQLEGLEERQEQVA